ncbi:hypothetical protein B0T17DRAFT_513527 [Bombardia bombarda]|uniref:Secreted protein n=1 Tax=Bombardia bombarda TaxID=252184 RepID=A0AA40CDR9_9PEZI|nr:hypothetical protein B0T17DRAFT_513527 [Bombardia bombarda]
MLLLLMMSPRAGTGTATATATATATRDTRKSSAVGECHVAVTEVGASFLLDWSKRARGSVVVVVAKVGWPLRWLVCWRPLGH